MTLRVLLALLVAMLAIAVSTTAVARKFDMNFSDESAQFKYDFLIGATNYGRTELGVGFIYNEDDNNLAEISLQVIDQAGSKTPGLELGVGPKVYAADTNAGDVAAVGLGGQLRYKNPRVPRVIYVGMFYFAPGIVSFLDAEDMYEFAVRLQYEVLPSANAYVGYRKIEVEFEKIGDVEIDDSVHVGLEFKF
ncbi:MAG: hypothetical protein GXP08_05450 [Gammaproteobacteria bacterium]|nr:hypothetical protein [Gammaproteobacteria bacterium]